MDKPEALRLAEFCDGNVLYQPAAAELRRLANVEAQRDALLEALKTADQFITNGMELGFIRMPDAATPDSAHETPGIVRAAIKAVEETK
jgi:hypothetical protein